MKKVTLTNICNMMVTIKSNNRQNTISIYPEKSHVFESENEYAKFEVSAKSMIFTKFLKMSIGEVKENEKYTDTVIDSDIVNAIEDINKQIDDLKAEFKASKDADRKKEIKKEIKKLNTAIKDLS